MKYQLQKPQNLFITYQLTKYFRLLPVLILSAIFTISSAYATTPTSIPKKKHTTLELYFTPVEAHNQMQQYGNRTLFIDVRDPIEVNYNGMPSVADTNVPLKFADTRKFHMKKKQFNMKPNKNFVSDVDERLKSKGLIESDPIDFQKVISSITSETSNTNVVLMPGCN